MKQGLTKREREAHGAGRSLKAKQREMKGEQHRMELSEIWESA